MKSETVDRKRTFDTPIEKPAYPLPAIFEPARRTRYSTKVEWEKVGQKMPPRRRSATALSKSQ